MPVACQAPLSMEFSSKEYWSGLPILSPLGLPGLEIEPVFPESPALAGGFFTTELPGRLLTSLITQFILQALVSFLLPPN